MSDNYSDDLGIDYPSRSTTSSGSDLVAKMCGFAVIAGLLAVMMSTSTTVEARSETTTQEAGKIYTKTIKQEFGKQEVLAATIARDPKTNADFIYVEVEGMPCVVYHPNGNRGGLSCDWSRWEGRSFGEAQKPHPSEVQKIIDDYKKSQQPTVSPIVFPGVKASGVTMR